MRNRITPAIEAVLGDAPEADDEATCDSSAEERELMQAIQAYKASSGRMFPTWSEVLEVLRDLGYDKRETGDRVSGVA